MASFTAFQKLERERPELSYLLQTSELANVTPFSSQNSIDIASPQQDSIIITRSLNMALATFRARAKTVS